MDRVAVRSELRPQAVGLPEVEDEAGNLSPLTTDEVETAIIIAGAVPVGIQTIATGVEANSRGKIEEVVLETSKDLLNQHRKGCERREEEWKSLPIANGLRRQLKSPRKKLLK